MYFPDKKNKRFTAAILITSILAILCLSILDLGGDSNDAHPKGLPQGTAYTEVYNQTPANTVAAAAATNSSTAKTRVAYGTTKYPSLTNISYDTFRKLDYQEKSGKYTYFYDFRDTWYAGCNALDGKYVNKIYTDRQGFWGIRASIEGNVLTYEAFSDLDNVEVYAVEFRTYDDAEKIVLDATANTEHIAKTTNLKNGPYAFCVWFDFTHEDGTVETVSAWQTVYVSDGVGKFADRELQASDQAMKTWLTDKKDSLTIDDIFQAWVAKQGGNDLEKAADVTVIHYPFKSNTSRYPDNSGKWRNLAHEICPDEDASDYAKAYALFAWMKKNIAYDEDVPLDREYRWAEAAASGSAKGYTMWDSHLGMCLDFSNVYAIMCRELGIPCHVMGTFSPNHVSNIVYLNGRWEIVDVNAGIRSARVGTDNKAYAANVKAYWAKQKTGDDYTNVGPFCTTAYGTFKVSSYEADEYAGVVDKFNKTVDKLNVGLFDAAYYKKWAGTIYGH